jgi:hypothetical protein
MTIDRIGLVMAALLGTTAANAVAQEGVVDTLSRAAICESAIATLGRRPTATTYSSAVSELPACPAAGATALRGQWEQLPADTIDVRVLGEVTPRLRDRQVFESVLAVYRDGSRPRAARLAGLEALVGYYQPGLVVEYVEPKMQLQHGSAYVRVGWGDPTTTTGAIPLSTGTRGEILAALDEVGKQDPDDRLRLISVYIRTRLVALP